MFIYFLNHTKPRGLKPLTAKTVYKTYDNKSAIMGPTKANECMITIQSSCARQWQTTDKDQIGQLWLQTQTWLFPDSTIARTDYLYFCNTEINTFQEDWFLPFPLPCSFENGVTVTNCWLHLYHLLSSHWMEACEMGIGRLCALSLLWTWYFFFRNSKNPPMHKNMFVQGKTYTCTEKHTMAVPCSKSQSFLT